MGFNKIKNMEGVTMVALTITIIILLIVASIAFNSGKEVINKAKLEELRTNMLLIQAKAKEYVEEATFKMGIKPDDDKKNTVREEVYIQEAKLEKADIVPAEFEVSDTSTCYWLTEETFKDWGLDEIKLKTDEKYLIVFDETNETAEIYNTIGYNRTYSLSKINEIEL